MKNIKCLTLAVLALGLLLIPIMGIAEDFAGPPAFSVDLGEGFVKGEPSGNQVLTGKTASGFEIYINIFDIDDYGSSAKDYCQSWVNGVIRMYEHLVEDDIEIIENKEFELEDGSMSWRCVVEWPWSNGYTMLNSYILTSDKDGKRIAIWGTASGGFRDDEVIDIVESLMFK